MNFLLKEMTFLRYFMPLIIEGNKRGITSKVFWDTNTKYSNPLNQLGFLKEEASTYGFKLLNVGELNEYPDTTFMVEGVSESEIKYKAKKIVLTSMLDFRVHYRDYVDSVDNVIMCSKFMAQYHNAVSDKNLYLGSPKYDIDFDKEYILKKYGLPDEKVVTVFVPNTAEIKRVDLKRVNRILSRMGYKVVTKTRGKWPVHKDNVGDFYFEDYSWYPHSSLELIEVSDFIVNFDSSVIKECVMLDTPVLDFDIRGDKRRLPFLYKPDFCVMLKLDFRDADMVKAIESVTSSDYKDSFKQTRLDYLFERGNVAKTIVDRVLQ